MFFLNSLFNFQMKCAQNSVVACHQNLLETSLTLQMTTALAGEQTAN